MTTKTILIVLHDRVIDSVIVDSSLSDSKWIDLCFEYTDKTYPCHSDNMELFDITNPRHLILFKGVQ
jgi:hypothetical protein